MIYVINAERGSDCRASRVLTGLIRIDTEAAGATTPSITKPMKFAFEIMWVRDGSLEPLLQPAPLSLQSIEAARALAMQFASYVPVHSITIEAEDGSVVECWSWLRGTSSERDGPAVTQLPALQARLA